MMNSSKMFFRLNLGLLSAFLLLRMSHAETPAPVYTVTWPESFGELTMDMQFAEVSPPPEEKSASDMPRAQQGTSLEQHQRTKLSDVTTGKSEGNHRNESTQADCSALREAPDAADECDASSARRAIHSPLEHRVRTWLRSLAVGKSVLRGGIELTLAGCAAWSEAGMRQAATQLGSFRAVEVIAIAFCSMVAFTGRDGNCVDRRLKQAAREGHAGAETFFAINGE